MFNSLKLIVTILLSSSLILTGCGGGDFSENLEASASERAEADAQSLAVSNIREINDLMFIGQPSIYPIAGSCRLTQKVRFKTAAAFAAAKSQLGHSNVGNIQTLLTTHPQDFFRASNKQFLVRMKEVLGVMGGMIYVDPSQTNTLIFSTWIVTNGLCTDMLETSYGRVNFGHWLIGITAGAIIRVGVGVLLTLSTGASAETLGLKLIAGCVGGTSAALIADSLGGFPSGTNQVIAQLVFGCIVGAGTTQLGPLVDELVPALRAAGASMRAWLVFLGARGVPIAARLENIVELAAQQAAEQLPGTAVR